ncbi:hypothetical protein NBRC10512_004647 [Rhodotorula toruloides]|uniref:amidase n=2 Tax=Rhodotorula toruloides TaxID=5286 RepID=A0A061BHA1_RHOTO|nr:general amidase GmdA [Rhodotorula toruloides NP11]EMS24763.1 general amidase GmdA [Rhodotorula toruloides NP11]CDR47269.1 RHTO0S14e01310g1_1 [Rhodotorula toruloides]
MPSVIPDWQQTAAHAQAAFKAKVEATGFAVPTVSPKQLNVTSVALKDVLSSEEIAITGSSIGELVAKLAKGDLSSEQRTFCHRAVIAQHALTNCLTDIFFDHAIERAKHLDAEFARTGKPSGPLHGLPVSLKNQIDVEGEEMNLCYVGWVGRIAKKNSAMAECLLRSGAVLYCFTNMPQALMSGETVCNLHGRTTNPHNRALAAGGSSGGEGALVALHGSPIGIGSDIGGSVRIPCAFNGLYGLRPSFERMPYGGSTNSTEGFTVIPLVLSAMSSSLDSVKLFFKAALDAEPWSPLCFGFISHNGIAKPDPPYLRALETMKKALLAKGHKVIDYTPVDAAKGSSILTKPFLADGGEAIATQCATSGEPLMEGAFKGVVKPPAVSTYAFWQLCRDRRDYIAEQLAAWERTKELTGTGCPVVALISPPAPYPSFRHGDLQDIFYTGICNLCDYPAAVFPVTKVDPAVDIKAEPYDFASDFDKINYERYDAEVYRDAPVALQLIGRKGEDEAVIKMMELAVEALQSA